MRHGLAFMFLFPLPAFAGTSYVVTNTGLSPRSSAVSVAQYSCRAPMCELAGPTRA